MTNIVIKPTLNRADCFLDYLSERTELSNKQSFYQACLLFNNDIDFINPESWKIKFKDNTLLYYDKEGKVFKEKLPESLITLILNIAKELHDKDIHGYGYLPYKVASKLSRFSDNVKTIQKDYPLFNCCLNCNQNEIGVYVDYDGNVDYFINFKENIDYKYDFIIN